MTTQEKLIFKYLRKKYPSYIVHNFAGQDIDIYETYIKTHKMNGIIAIYPPFKFQGRTYYNDFAIIKPTGEKIAIECKDWQESNYRLIQLGLMLTKEIIENEIVFLLEGNGFKNASLINQFNHDNSKTIYSMKDLFKYV